jgi:hypothetical protein
MSNRTYTLEPQRLIEGKGYVACEQHRASRIVIVEVTKVPAKQGRRSYFIRRNHQIYSGSAMLLRARQDLDVLVRGTKRRDEPKSGKIWGRSLTIKEYDAVMNRKREEGSY